MTVVIPVVEGERVEIEPVCILQRHFLEELLSKISEQRTKRNREMNGTKSRTHKGLGQEKQRNICNTHVVNPNQAKICPMIYSN